MMLFAKIQTQEPLGIYQRIWLHFQGEICTIRTILTISFLSLCLVVQGQKESNQWLFGSKGGVDFNCSPPVPFNGISHFMLEGCATISDRNGNLLFATNGDTVWDKTFQAMPNGFDLAGKCDNFKNSGTQPALIVPKPESHSLYYIFTTDCIEDTLHGGLRYSIVDMSLNNGKGAVTSKNKLLFAPACEKLAAIQHGSNYWIVARQFGTNKFYAYSLTHSGLSAPVVSATGQVQFYTPVTAALHIPEQMARGYLKFSPNGENLISLAMPDELPHISQAYVLHPEVFSFNDTTGVVKSEFIIDHPDSIPYYGATFSPDGTKLYLSGGWAHPYLHQFDLAAGSQSAIVGSRTLINIDSAGTPNNAGAMQLATDGKIYIATNNVWLDVIANPDSTGALSNYQHKALRLSDCPLPTFSTWGLPNFIESYFQTITPSPTCFNSILADFSYTDTCLNSVTQFYDETAIFPEKINFWKWDFGDTASGTGNFSSIQNPQHKFSSAGKFTVKLITMTDTNAICKSDTVTKVVTIEVCTGVHSVSQGTDHVNIFPNPSADDFTLQFKSNRVEVVEILVYDTAGKLITAFEKRSHSIATIRFGKELPIGVYFVKVRWGDLVLAKKLIKL